MIFIIAYMLGNDATKYEHRILIGYISWTMTAAYNDNINQEMNESEFFLCNSNNNPCEYFSIIFDTQIGKLLFIYVIFKYV